MTNRRSWQRLSQDRYHGVSRPKKRAVRAGLNIETLEQRMLLTTGPQLISIQPNVGELLRDGDLRSVAPRELTFRFNATQGIDPTSLDGIQVRRAGPDGQFGTSDDVTVAVSREKGLLGNDVVVRFGDNLPDDLYQIAINSGLRAADGTPFDADPDTPGNQEFRLQFRLDLGTQITAVVPQPIRRDLSGHLVQANDQVEVYFNDNDLDPALASNPLYYQLILTNDTVTTVDDIVFHPAGVSYDAVNARAILTFSNDLHTLAGGSGTFRLRVGTAENIITKSPLPDPTDLEPTVGNEIGDSFATAFSLPTSLTQTPSQSFIGQVRTQSTPVVLEYNFQTNYGGASFPTLTNLITEQQKQRIRESFEIYGSVLGLKFLETTNSGLTVAVGDLRVVGGLSGLGGPRFGLDGNVPVLVFDNAENWTNEALVLGTQGRPSFFADAVQAIGGGLDVPTASAMPFSAEFGDTRFLQPDPESAFTVNYDFAATHLFGPDSVDIDMFRFEVTGGVSGLFTAEIYAERSLNPSFLDSTMRLYREITQGTNYELIAQNDDYFGADPLLQLALQPGVYFLGVSSTGNDNYNPLVAGSGYGGTTFGQYELRLDFRPDIADSLRDIGGVAFDGDNDGVPGGVFHFWFRAAAPSGTELPNEPRVIYVDKADTTPDTGPDAGTLANPYNRIHDALNQDRFGLPKTGAAFDPNAARPGDIVRIVGNGDSPETSLPYEVGLNSLTNQPLADGNNLNIPTDVTVVIDGGALVKLRRSAIFVGSMAVGIDNSNAALQVLGTPTSRVLFTSIDDLSSTTFGRRGDWGGIVFAGTLDKGAGRAMVEDQGIFLNHIAHAELRFGGGIVNVGSVPQAIAPVDIRDLRPTIQDNLFSRNSVAAISATPNSFEETTFHAPQFQLPLQGFQSDYSRVGPDIHGNTLDNNTINGLFIRIETPAGNQLQKLTVSARWDDADIIHVLSEVLQVSGNPGGLTDFGTLATRPHARLAVDPGIIVKLDGARIEVEIGAQLIAEGYRGQEVVFTSVRDNRFGASGNFNTANQQTPTPPSPGDWAGLYLGHSAIASIDHAYVGFAGGVAPIQGNFVGFNALEIHQAKARVTNSTFAHLASGIGGQGSVTREGRGKNAPAVIFVRGAQPILASNSIYSAGATDPAQVSVATSSDDLVAAVSINADSLNHAHVTDYGRSTGFVSIIPGSIGNQGPWIRDNRLEDNDINGMVVRGQTLSTESVWDDTDIVHVLFDNIHVPNFRNRGGLRLESSPTESLVVKLGGQRDTAGFDATGTPNAMRERVGGSLHIVGQPGRPVIMTSLTDSSDGAGKGLDGTFQNQTLRSGFGTNPIAQGFQIDLHYSTEVEQNPVLVAAFEEAARFWEDRITDNIRVGFDVFIVERGSEPFASAGAAGFAAPFDEVIARMQAKAAPDEVDLLNRLPTFSQLRVQAPQGTTITPNEVISMGYPNAKALGYIQGVDLPPIPSETKIGQTRDGVIDVTALFDRSTTVDGFALVMIHEIGHALGFSSSIPEDGTFGPNITLTTLDLFRMEPGAGASDFTNNARVLDPQRQHVFYDGGFFDPTGINITGLTLGDIPLSRGEEPHPDDAQPSHWRSQSAIGMNGINLGIMDPGAGGFVRPNDERALGLLGYNFVPFRIPSEPTPGDWRGIQLDELANDRNVDAFTELETPDGNLEGSNNIPTRAQFLGALAKGELESDERLRLGFQVSGVLHHPGDIDVYSFDGFAGTEIWLDIDKTSSSLDTVVELISSNGNVLARSNDSLLDDHTSPSGTVTTGSLSKSGFYPDDVFSLNPKDAGMRLTLPGVAGTRGTYFVRVRSNNDNLNVATGGKTQGAYELNVRLREIDEVPGTVIKFADIRYARNGISASGQPSHSPLNAEFVETSDITSYTTAMNLGDLFASERGEISVSGLMEPIRFDSNNVLIDGVDWYRFSVGSAVPGIVIDVDYADGAGGPNIHVALYRVGISEGATDEPDDDYAIYDLVYFGDSSNIPTDLGTSFTAGSFGTNDPFIGPIYPEVSFDTQDLEEVIVENGVTVAGSGSEITYLGNYLMAVMSEALRPEELIDQFLHPAPRDPESRILPTEFIEQIQVQLPGVNIPFTLNDMALYVIGDGGTTLNTVNPFSGAPLQAAGRALRGEGTDSYTVGSLAMRGDGRLFSLSLGTNDEESGNFLEIDWAQRVTEAGTLVPQNVDNLRDDEIATFALDPMDPTQVVDFDDGIQFQGLTITGSTAYAVGSRGGATDPNLTGPLYVNNIVYQIDAYPNIIDQNNTEPGTALPTEPRRESDLAGTPPMDGAFTDVLEAGVFQTPANEIVQGLAFFNNALYGVTNLGALYRLVLGAPGTPGTTTRVGTIQGGVNFSDLALGPPNLGGGAFAQTFFAISNTGELFAFTETGAPVNAFSGGTNRIATGISSPTGIAFSTLDRNLWQVNAAGTEITFSAIPTFTPPITAAGRFFTGNQSDANQFNADYNYPGGAQGTFETTFDLSSYSAGDLPTLYFSYELRTQNPETNEMCNDYSVQGQFDCTENRFHHDAMRVYADDGSGNWRLLATNNSATQFNETGDGEHLRPDPDRGPFEGTRHHEFDILPADGRTDNNTFGYGIVQEIFDNTQQLFGDDGIETQERQVRVSLAELAGHTNVTLRFEFSTKGSFNEGRVGDAFGNYQAVPERLPDGSTDNQFFGATVRNIVIGPAERGEQFNQRIIANDNPRSARTPNIVSYRALTQGTTLSGRYQFYIRPAQHAAFPIGSYHTNEVFEYNSATSIGFGDENRLRDQGQLILHSNSISHSEQFGIRIEPSPRVMTGAANLRITNTHRLTRGPVIENNLIVDSGAGGILFTGNANGTGVVPFGRVINNTIVGSSSGQAGVGITVGPHASPTLMNNVIAFTQTALSVHTSSNSTVVAGQFLHQNGTNGPLGSFAMTFSQPLFRDPANGNYLLRNGVTAIDSGVNSQQDRPEIVAVNSTLGIGFSPILAPDRDGLGQLRIDDPNVSSPPGLGFNVIKDRGAFERADDAGPIAELLTPADNSDVDHDNRPNIVQTFGATFRVFEIRLSDLDISGNDLFGVGLDDATVTPETIIVRRDTSVLELGIDYALSYDSTNDIVRIIPLAGIWVPGVYQIELTAGIRDREGNSLAPNSSSGTTKFDLFIDAIDFGDAPDPPYPSLLANDGARHLIEPGFYLGSGVTGEADALTSIGATGDNEDDGIEFGGVIRHGLPVEVTVIASGIGFVDGWIDYNRDGDWDDAGEQIFTSQPVVSGNNTFTITVPADAVVGDTFGRFRLSRNGGLGTTGLAPSGEVEDYRITINDLGTDFGDAPEPYPTLLANQGASHKIVSGFYLGGLVTPDADGQPSVNADADDGDDGVTFDSILTVNQDAQITVETSAAGLLDAWIDFNQDGDWDDPGEQIFVSHVLTAGTNFLSLAVPADAAVGHTFARFRFSSVGGLSPVGPALDGEVEDYRVVISPEITPDTFDFGDAPGPFPTLLVNDGPRHVAVPGYFLGAGISTEIDGQPSANADADSFDDGVTFGDLLAGQPTIVTVVASGFGFIDGWIDFNGDGDWNDAGEQIFVSEQVGPGVNTFTIQVPEAAFHGNVFARFRFSSQGGLATTGQALDGEVEDYRVNLIQPTQTWHNYNNPVDVNGQDGVTPIDALLVINELDSATFSDPVTGLLNPNPTPPPFLDVTNDGFVSPLDALLVINALPSTSGASSAPGAPLSMGAFVADDGPAVQRTTSSKPRDDAESSVVSVPQLRDLALRSVLADDDAPRHQSMATSSDEGELSAGFDTDEVFAQW